MVALFSGPRVLKYSARMITVGMPWILNIQTWHPLLAPSTTLRFTLSYSKQLHRTAKVLKTDRDRWSCLEYPIFVLLFLSIFRVAGPCYSKFDLWAHEAACIGHLMWQPFHPQAFHLVIPVIPFPFQGFQGTRVVSKPMDIPKAW